MIKKFFLIAIISIFIIGILYIVLPFNRNSNPYQKQQETLAEQLGVKIDDYSFPQKFPIDYFNSLLKPGMSPKEVHEIVTGYEKMYACGAYSEIYYYFSKSDDKALRFEIFYDKERKYEKLQGEDDNSRYIRTDNCILGRRIGE